MNARIWSLSLRSSAKLGSSNSLIFFSIASLTIWTIKLIKNKNSLEFLLNQQRQVRHLSRMQLALESLRMYANHTLKCGWSICTRSPQLCTLQTSPRESKNSRLIFSNCLRNVHTAMIINMFKACSCYAHVSCYEDFRIQCKFNNCKILWCSATSSPGPFHSLWGYPQSEGKGPGNEVGCSGLWSSSPFFCKNLSWSWIVWDRTLEGRRWKTRTFRLCLRCCIRH